AVIGCLVAGFYLLRVYDLTTASLTAVALNAIVGCVAFLLSTRAPYPLDHGATEGTTRSAHWQPRGIYAAIALSGFTALGAEVVWTRLLSLLFGATTYTFSLILAVFLFGLGIGSSIGSAMASRVARPRVALGWCQLLLCASMA